MLKQFMPKLIQELELEESIFDTETPGIYVLPLEDGVSITINDMANQFIIKSLLAPLPPIKQDEFTSEMMLANLFGQGTCGAVLGLNAEGNTLVLTRIIDYTIDYKEFRGIIEDFINMVDFWREEARTQV